MLGCMWRRGFFGHTGERDRQGGPLGCSNKGCCLSKQRGKMFVLTLTPLFSSVEYLFKVRAIDKPDTLMNDPNNAVTVQVNVLNHILLGRE